MRQSLFAFCLLQGFTGSFVLDFIGQLDGAAWTVEIFDFSIVNAWVTAGTLAGSEYRAVEYIFG